MRRQPSPGEEWFVTLESWAGRSTHLVRIERVCTSRAKVTWLDASVLGRVRGAEYYVPLRRLTRVGKSHPDGWTRYLTAERQETKG